MPLFLFTYKSQKSKSNDALVFQFVLCCLVAAAVARPQDFVEDPQVYQEQPQYKTLEDAGILRMENTMNEDGSFQYGFETTDPIQQDVAGQPKQIGDEIGIVMQGSYSYTAEDENGVPQTYTVNWGGRWERLPGHRRRHPRGHERRRPGRRLRRRPAAGRLRGPVWSVLRSPLFWNGIDAFDLKWPDLPDLTWPPSGRCRRHAGRLIVVRSVHSLYLCTHCTFMYMASAIQNTAYFIFCCMDLFLERYSGVSAMLTLFLTSDHVLLFYSCSSLDKKQQCFTWACPPPGKAGKLSTPWFWPSNFNGEFP